MANQQQLFVGMSLTGWREQLNRTNKLFESLTDAELEQPVAPGRNSGRYLLGHLTAVHDSIIPLLGLGEKKYPDLEKPFITNPESAKIAAPDIPQLRERWNTVNQALTTYFEALSPESWFERHTAVSPEDFAREPHRNKLNVLLSRTAHLSYHRGQLVFLQKK